LTVRIGAVCLGLITLSTYAWFKYLIYSSIKAKTLLCCIPFAFTVRASKTASNQNINNLSLIITDLRRLTRKQSSKTSLLLITRTRNVGVWGYKTALMSLTTFFTLTTPVKRATYSCKCKVTSSIFLKQNNKSGNPTNHTKYLHWTNNPSFPTGTVSL
jgi:hypothetical protein